MMNLKTTFILALLLAIAFSCVEPYDVRAINFERTIVVEGRITNEPKINYVKLSYTRPVDVQRNLPLSGAEVWVESRDGGKIEFTESDPGHYQLEEGVAGEFGKSYLLFFTTADGRQYQSDVQELIASPPIASIYHQYAEKASSTSGDVYKGIQFFIDTKDESNRAKYFKYEWEETYEVMSPFVSTYEFSSDPDTAIARKELVNVCYQSAKSNAITLGTTANLTANSLSGVPVRYLTTATDHLRYAYSILVKQYTISAEAYSFYRDFLENNKNNESLFDKQLGVVVGNITSVDNPDETVLGFFEVAGVSEKRTFVKYKDLDPRFPWPDPSYPCSEDQIVAVIDSIQPLPYKLKDSVSYYIRQGYEIYTASYCDSISKGASPPPCGFYFSAKLVPRYCGDCRFRGPATKPEFWIY